MRYWIRGEDEDFDRELRRAQAAGDPLPADLSFGARVAVGAMIAVQITAFSAIAFLIMEWLSG